MTATRAILIHGLAGSPHEFNGVQESLEAQGIPTTVITLPQHGDSATVLTPELTLETLLQHCQQQLQQYQHNDIILVGHSLGAALTLCLAGQNNPNIKAVVSLSAPYNQSYLYTHQHLYCTIPPLRAIKALRYLKDAKTGLTKPKIPTPTLLHLQQEAKLLFKLLAQRIPEIKAPTLLMHSRYDLTIGIGQVYKIKNQLPHAKVIELQHSGHQVLPQSQDTPLIIESLHQFIKSTSKG